MQKKDLIPIDFKALADGKTKLEGQLVLTDEEMKTFPHFVSLEELFFEFVLSGADPFYAGSLYIYGKVTVLDNHTLRPETVDFDNEEEYTFDLGDPDNSSFEPDRDGNYYLRNQILISLDDAVPRSFSLHPARSFDYGGVRIVTEDEWNREVAKIRNPFAALDDSMFEDGEEASGENEERGDEEECEEEGGNADSYYREVYGDGFFDGLDDDEDDGRGDGN